jgi:GMP synthase (glutamine-hydrolysing)
MQPVLLIGHDPDETFGVAPGTLEAAGIPYREHRADRPTSLPALPEISGLVIFGGTMNVDMTDRYPFLGDERALVRTAVDSGVPYLGICLGSQMLARALDHPVYPAGVREIGFNAVHPTSAASGDPLVSVFGDGDMVFHWHEDTFGLPEGATLLATGDLVPMQAFRYGDAAWGIQFHLEVDRAEVGLWLEIAGEDEVLAWGKTAEQVRQETERYIDGHEARARELFGRFWELVRAAA